MRLTRFFIRQYGPLSTPDEIQLGNFNLFWGQNENGKTMTLEALVRILVGAHRRLFPNIERISEDPDGYVLASRPGETEIRLPDGGKLTDLLDLSPEEFRNLFVIRNSDLSIARENQFYSDISERLTGLRTSQLEGINRRLRELGHFTEGMDTRSTRDNYYLKERVKRAHQLLLSCERLHKTVTENQLDNREEQLVLQRLQHRRIRQEIRDLEGARLREKYEVGSKEVEAVQQHLVAVKQLGAISEEDLSRWQSAELLLEQDVARRKSLMAQLHEHQQELSTLVENTREKGRKLESAQEHRARLDAELRPLLRLWGDYKDDMARRIAGRPFVQGGAVVAALVAVITGVMLFSNPHPWLLLGSTLSGLLAVLMAMLYFFRFVKPGGALQQLQSRIMAKAGELGLPGSNIYQVREYLQKFETTLQVQLREYHDGEGRRNFLLASIDALEKNRLPALEKRMSEARKVLADLERKNALHSGAALKERLAEKQRLHQRMQEGVHLLSNLFTRKHESLEDNIREWVLAADALSEYRQAGKGVRFDERKLEKRKNDLQESQDQLTRLEEEMSEFRVSIREINEEVQRIIFPEEEDFLSGETVADLQRVQRRVQGFIEGVERRQYLAGSALKIFRDIELQERRKVESLFGKGSAVSTLFAAITGGAYPEVTFDGQQSLIRVRREDGTILPPEWLSSGTYDQLYFTIRIALGEKLLGRERGFFILDDPFLKSDRARLRSQMKVLLEVARQGWQILFFSAKDEVREALQKSIDEGEVKLQPMPQLAYRRG